MQQTNTYQFNLIEGSDTFSPAPLNENMTKLEAALADARTDAGSGLSREEAARIAADAALDLRLSALEVHKVAVGSYDGTGAAPRNFQLGFTPKAVLVQTTSKTGSESALISPGCPFKNQPYDARALVEIVSGGFSVNAANFNQPTLSYAYFAFV